MTHNPHPFGLIHQLTTIESDVRAKLQESLHALYSLRGWVLSEEYPISKEETVRLIDQATNPIKEIIL